MQAKTRKILDELKTYPWFLHVLQPMAENRDAIQMPSWEAAVDCVTGNVWASVQLQVKNRLAREVNQRDYLRFSSWKAITAELRKDLGPIIATYIQPLIYQQSCDERLLHAVQWDLMGICVEAEFADVYPPIFFLPVLNYWYQQGRFPCGWDGPGMAEGWKGDLPRHKLFVL